MLVTDLGITGELSDADNWCYGISFFFLTTDYQFIKKVDLGIGSGDFHLDSWLITDGVICLTVSGLCRSMSRLWILI